MLTSSSTGNAKAVQLGHSQMLSAVAGKMAMRCLPHGRAFMNWIGLDHVAALLETHLSALWLGVDQVHVQAADLIASPSLFLELLSRHRVSRTFAPNFFLAQLVAANPSPDPSSKGWDLSGLAAVVSGGETNDMNTILSTTALLGRFVAPSNVIQPGFGMTETCAGAIYNVHCPAYEVAQGLDVASLGHCIPGIEMRVVRVDGKCCGPEEIGALEVRGAVVFEAYYRNPEATAAAFPSGNKWFRTGDQASIDHEGSLSMVGRTKDVININGVKIVTADVQHSLDKALRGTCVGRAICFPTRPREGTTEQITVALVARGEPIEASDLAHIDRLVGEAYMMVSPAGLPRVFVLRASSLPLLPTTTLGKISGAKMRTLFESGAFDEDVACYVQILEDVRLQRRQVSSSCAATTEEEKCLQADFAETKKLGVESGRHRRVHL